jgi:micrococcal nuclease
MYCCFSLVLLLAGCNKAVNVKQISIVVDGDSVVLQGESALRLDLAFIDAPEREQPYGREAKDYLKQLVNSGTVEVLVNDNNQVELQQNNQSVNLMLVEQGYAWASLNIADPIEAFRYIEAQKTAIANLDGLWGLGHGLMVAPWQWRQQGTERSVMPRRPVQKRPIPRSMQQHNRRSPQTFPKLIPKPTLVDSSKAEDVPKQKDVNE